MEEKHGTGSCGILLHCNIRPAVMSNELAKRYGMIPIVLRIVHKDDVSPWRIALIHLYGGSRAGDSRRVSRSEAGLEGAAMVAEGLAPRLAARSACPGG